MGKFVIKQPTDFIKIGSTITLIYGQPGVRKSSYAFTAPKPVMFDFDEGCHRIDAKFRGLYIPAEQLRRWEDVASIDPNDFQEFETFIFDSVTKMMDYLQDYVIRQNAKNGKAGGGLSLQGYGALGEAFRSFIKKIRVMGKHVVFVAHDKESKEGDTTRLRPDIVGSNLGVVTKDADLIGYMEMVNNVSVIQFSPTERFYAKNSCGLPHQMNTGEMTIADIITKYEEAINNQSAELAEYKAIMLQVSTGVEECENIEDLNLKYEVFKTTNHVITSKIDGWELFKSKAEELNCDFVKEKQAFVEKQPVADAA